MARHHNLKHKKGTTFWKLSFLTVITVLIFVASQLLTKARFESPPLRQISSTKGFTQDQAKDVYLKLPISFEANRGQIDPKVRFMARGVGYNVFLTSGEVVLALSKSENGPKSKNNEDAPEQSSKTIDPMETAVLRIKPVNANPSPELVGIDEFRGRTNYLIGNDSGKWQRNVPTYQRIEYKDIYPGIDLVWYGNQRRLEYDFVVAPGVDPGIIKLAIQGANKISLDDNGNLVFEAAGGKLIQHKPIVYQETNGVRQQVACSYLVSSDHIVAFQIENYDPELPLIIDPVLSYSSYLGGANADQGNSIATDGNGNIFVTGSTERPIFPVGNPNHSSEAKSTDVFITKLNTNESGEASLIFSTYLGGRGEEQGNKIALDEIGNIYVTGTTSSVEFPIKNAFQPSLASSPIFRTTDSAAQWGSAGEGLSATTVNSIAIDPNEVSLMYAATSTGVSKSTDNGETWETSASTEEPDDRLGVNSQTANVDRPTGNTTEGLRVSTRDIIVDPRNTSVLYAATNTGIHKSTSAGRNWTSKSSGLTVEDEDSENPTVVRDIRTVIIDPASNSTKTINLYAGTAKGIFKSDDGGENWSRIGADNIPCAVTEMTCAVTAIAIDPSAYSLVYAGTDKGVVYKSSDNGRTWSEHKTFDSAINVLAVDPGSPDDLFVGTSQGVWKNDTQVIKNEDINSLAIKGPSADSPATPVSKTPATTPTPKPAPSIVYAGAVGRVFKSSDGGTKWVLSNDGQTNESPIKALAIDPADSSIVYLGATGTSDAFLSKLSPGGSSLEYSTFIGGGDNDWANGLAVDNNGKAYLTGSTSSSNFPGVSELRSAEDQKIESFPGVNAFVTKLDTTKSENTSLVYSKYLGGSADDAGNAIAVDSSGNAYVTGSTESSNFPVSLTAFQKIYGNTKSGVFLNNDDHTASGDDWVKFGDELSQSVFSIVGSKCEMSECPPIYAGTVSGVYKRTDQSTNWQQKDSGLDNSNIRDLALNPRNADIIYAGTSRGIFKSTDAAETWSSPVSDDSAVKNNTVPTVAIDQELFAGLAFGGIYKSTNGGVSWVLSSKGLPQTKLDDDNVVPISSTDNINDLETDPGVAIYAGTSAGLFKSEPNGENWELKSSGLLNDERFPPPAEGESTANVTTIAVGEDVLYAGVDGAGLFKSTDEGNNWAPAGVPSTDVTSVVISPDTDQIVYAGTRTGVFRSIDNGNTWQMYNAALTNKAVTTLFVRNPASEAAGSLISEVYAGVGLLAGDAFLAKLNADGSILTYSSFFGGDDWDTGNDIVLGQKNVASIAGSTNSVDFPNTMNGYSTEKSNGTDAFLMMIDTSGSGEKSLSYGTFLGGNRDDFANSLAVDDSGNSFITGSTSSLDFPVEDALMPIYNGSNDAFVLALEKPGKESTGLIFSTYFGGGGFDSGSGLALDSTGSVFVTGTTSSTNLLVRNAMANILQCPQNRSCASDAFVARINESTESADLKIEMSHSGTFRRGESGVFSSHVWNLGPSPAAPVRVINSLSPGLSFVSYSGEGWSCTSDGRLVTCVHEATLEPSENTRTTVSISVMVESDLRDEITSVSSTSVVSSTIGDPNAGNNRRFEDAIVRDACSNTISPENSSFTSSGGTGEITVETEAKDCFWTAAIATPNSWISIVSDEGGTSRDRGTGNGTVRYSVADNPNPGERTGIINVAGNEFTVTQSGVECSFIITPTEVDDIPEDGVEEVEINVKTENTCPWTAASDASFIHIDPDFSGGTGNGKAKFSVDPNRFNTREGTIIVGGQTVRVTQDAGACSISLSPTSAFIPQTGGLGFITVTATAGCEWTSDTNVDFITIVSGTGSGNGIVLYFVDSITSAESRTGTINIGGESFTVFQNAEACTNFVITPPQDDYDSDGVLYGSIFVDSPLDSCFWTAESIFDWLVILPAENNGMGSGDEYLIYEVKPNPTTAARTGTATIAGQTFTLTQRGVQCAYSLSAEAEYFGRTGGTGEVAVNTQDPCGWTAVSQTSWITITGGGSNIGRGPFGYSVAPNTNNRSRAGIVAVAGKIFTVRQAGRSNQ